MFPFFVGSHVVVVLVVCLLEPLEGIFHMPIIMMNELVHRIRRHPAFTAASRPWKRATRQICKHMSSTK